MSVIPKKLISCDLSANRIYIHDGISGATTDDFASPATNPTGLAFDGTNLISCDITANKIYVHDGISEGALDFASPASNPTGLTIANGDLISCDTGANKIYVHDGISATIKDEFASPGAAPYGLAFDGTNLISCDRVAGSGDKIYIHDGISSTTTDDFATLGTDPSGLTFDGENLILCDYDSDLIYIYDGITSTILDSFASPGSAPSGLAVVPEVEFLDREGLEPFEMVELDLDFCNNTFSNSPCTASGAAGTECYNTRSTCQDPDNYDAGVKTYRFCTAGSRLPLGENLIPCLLSAAITSPQINLNQSVGLKGSAKIELQDFTHHDRGIDPYVATRTYAPETQGTFFGKLKARNIYNQSRPVRVYKGFFTGSFSLSDFDKYEYFVDRFEGLLKGGKFRIIAKDPLKLAADDRAKCPVPTSGTVFADFNAAASTFDLSPSGIGDDEYPVGTFKIRVGDEIITGTRASASETLTSLVRGENGTTAEDHEADDNVQLCKEWTEENVVDVVEDLLKNFTEIPDAYIDTAQWTAQKDGFLSSNIVNAIISEPEGVETLLNEIIEVNLINIFWNDRTSYIILNSIIPEDINSTPDSITENKSFIQDSISVKEEPKQRISQVRILYAPRDATKFGEQGDFREAYIAVDLDAESSDQYGETRIKTIMTRWLSAARRGIAIQSASRLLNSYRDNPIRADFTLDPKDAAHELGASFRIDSRQHQGVDGSNDTQRMRVVSITPPAKIGDNYKYSATSIKFGGRYGFIAPAGTPVYSSATDAQKEAYGFIAQADGTMLDGSDGYLIL